MPSLVLLSLIAFVPWTHAPRATLMEIQGNAHRSAFAGDDVLVEGVVTAITPTGFYFQDARGDDDPATSDAAFVSLSGSPARTGDLVEVEGSVSELLPGNDANNLTVTTIEAVRVVILARNRVLPAAIGIGANGRVPPTAMIDDALAEYRPTVDGLDFYESLEGMRVTLEDARAVGPPDLFGDAWAIPSRVASGLNTRGGLTARPLDANPERIRIRGARQAAGSTSITTGAYLGDVSGIIDYAFGSFELIPEAIRVTPAEPVPELTAFCGDTGHLLVASFNVRNLGPADTARSRHLADIIVSHLNSPDILALEEIQDNSGPTDDGTVAADATLRLLTDAVRAAGGPAYEARDVAPVDGADGGEPGGNIRVALMFRPDRVSLEDSVRLVDPANPAWNDTRKPLAGEFVAGDTRVFVVAVHFRSRSGSTPDFGATQPPLIAGTAQRAAQARVVRSFVDEVRRANADARIIVLGDFNDDWFSQTLAILEEGGALENLARSLPSAERYTYLYEGNCHAYDHVLASRSLSGDARFDVVHVNSEFADNASDHDPVVARLALAPVSPPTPGATIVSAYPNPSTGNVVIATGSPGASANVTIYDMRGAHVRTLRATREGTVVWDGCDEMCRRVASGVYFARVTGPSARAVRKVVLTR